jgi:hypothetical protein
MFVLVAIPAPKRMPETKVLFLNKKANERNKIAIGITSNWP